MARLKEIEFWYSKAIQQPKDTQLNYLESHLSENPDLLEDVRTLVLSEDDSQSLLTQLKNRLTEEEDTDTTIPKIFRYQLAEEIGRGGMAVVYRASRIDGVFEQEVAVKVLKRGMDTDEIIQRFSQERNVLARLKHPAIATIIDGGVTDDGRPYFVMELVDGSDIVSYAKMHRLSIRARLELLVKVCKALEFAHQNLIIHRDIKPSNVLIDSKGEVKLMDFGIAKLLTQGQQEERILEDRKFITPKFASPEQIAGEIIDVRSDVYQLGKLLELLTDDLDTPRDAKAIIRYAIRVEKDERYASVGELTKDIQNYLSNRPVVSRKVSNTYRFKKFVERNKALSLGVAIAVLSLGVALIISLIQIERVKEQRNLALAATKEANAIANTFELVINEGLDKELSGDTSSLLTQLELTLEALDSVPQYEGIQLRLNYKIGTTLYLMGYTHKSEKPLYKVLALIDKLGVSTDTTYLNLYNSLAEIAIVKGQYKAADSLLEVNINRLKRLDPSSYIRANLAKNYLQLAQLNAHSRNRDLNKAAAAIKAAETLYGTLGGNDFVLKSEEYLNVFSLYSIKAVVHRAKEQYDSALIADKQALSYLPKLPVRNTHYLAGIHGFLAKDFKGTGRYDSAIYHMRTAIKIEESTNLEPRTNLAAQYTDLGQIYRFYRSFDSSLVYSRKSLQMKRQMSINENLTISYMNIAQAHLEKGNLDSANHYGEQVMTTLAQQLPENHPVLGIFSIYYAHILNGNQEYDKALKILNQYEEILSDRKTQLSNLYYFRSNSYRGLNQYDSAVLEAQACVDIRNKLYPSSHPIYLDAQVLLYENLRRSKNKVPLELKQRMDAILQVKQPDILQQWYQSRIRVAR